VFRAIFLDRDGTIARDVHYCRRPQDFEILPTVPEAVRLFNANGFKVVVVTNQSGLARGFFTEETLSLIHKKMKDELAKAGARIDAIYYCSHHPNDGCSCRKPGTALFELASREMKIDLTRSFVVGDTEMDVKAGQAIGAGTVLVTTGLYHSPKANGHVDFTAGNLLQAAKWVLENAQGRSVNSQ
jgi:histidinol-phosphate phosphatase family protein